MLLIVLTLYVLLMSQFLLIAILMVLQSILLIKTSISVLAIAADCLMTSENIKKLTCWHPKLVAILAIWISFPFFFIFLLSFNFLRKRKNDSPLKIILTSVTFLTCILYRFSNPHNRFKSCFTCQFFTYIPSKKKKKKKKKEVNTSHLQTELRIFAISKFRFNNHNLFCLLLILFSGDFSLYPGPFSQPQLFEQAESNTQSV